MIKLFPLSIALSASAIFDSLAQDEKGIPFDAFASAVFGVEYDELGDDLDSDTLKVLLDFISFIGVKDSVIEDMVASPSSSGITKALSETFRKTYTMDDIISIAEDFASGYDDAMVEMDSMTSKPCPSGYKRKLVVKNQRPTWVCKRIGSRKPLSSAQKQALRKARLKSHSSLANYSRKKSFRVGKNRGMY